MAERTGFWSQTNRQTTAYQKTRLQLVAADHPLTFWALLGAGRAVKFVCWTCPITLARWVIDRAKTRRDGADAATVTSIEDASKRKAA